MFSSNHAKFCASIIKVNNSALFGRQQLHYKIDLDTFYLISQKHSFFAGIITSRISTY